MDYQALERELTRYFDELQALSTLSELDPHIANCLDNAATYIEGAIEIVKSHNPNRLEYASVNEYCSELEVCSRDPYSDEHPDYDPTAEEYLYGSF